jgi:hypothetical protein
MNPTTFHNFMAHSNKEIRRKIRKTQEEKPRKIQVLDLRRIENDIYGRSFKEKRQRLRVKPRIKLNFTNRKNCKLMVKWHGLYSPFMWIYCALQLNKT